MLCTTKYYQKDVIVADIVATDVPYRADSSGLTDSTVAIQRALDACRDLGGGVVYLPEGKYLVTDTITVPAGCVLQGDWQDPNDVDVPEYGPKYCALSVERCLVTVSLGYSSEVIFIYGYDLASLSFILYFGECFFINTFSRASASISVSQTI